MDAAAPIDIARKTGADAIEGANLYSVSFDAAGRPLISLRRLQVDFELRSLRFAEGDA